MCIGKLRTRQASWERQYRGLLRLACLLEGAPDDLPDLQALREAEIRTSYASCR